MDIAGYLHDVRRLYDSGQTTEHSFRPALERLFASIDDDLTVINEPRRLTDVGAPDFVFNRNGISVGWCEAKDLGKDITKFAKGDYSKEQKERYTKGLPNLLYTNGADFQFIKQGEVVSFITIANFIPTLPARPENFEALEHMLREFASQTPISIRGAKPLAQMMAGKAIIIKDIMGKALTQDIKANNQTDLFGQYEAFKASLIHDITVADFADIYAETIAYGLFAARLHDDTQDTFTRMEALELLPKSNPFLRKLFIYIAGPDLDDRLRWIVDEMCDVFRATDLHSILADFGKLTGLKDPFLHFYETFLAAYNPAKRKSRGVWYTPEPVVNYIVRAVDDVLKTEFGLPDGLADTSKINIDWDTGQTDNKGKPVTIKKDVHRVQILDPATGTGTFLAEVVKKVAGTIKDMAPAQWSSYVENDLLPRLNGFELLMASYAMCHMKLDMMLTELGYKPSTTPPRLRVFLTNSLEEGERVEQNLFGLSRDIANEAKEASDIKRQTPIMCIIGNPPYSGESANKGAWITELMEAYKKEPGGKEKLKERNPKWINDDYVKFIRFSEYMIAKNGEGVLGFITNHGYLDNPTFRGVRWHLLKTFDQIFVLDLHGNTNRKERIPENKKDKNVFDIKPGVSIIIGLLNSKNKKDPDALAKVMHAELFGTRSEKYEWLFEHDRNSIHWSELALEAPHYMFVPWDYDKERQFCLGFSLAELMPLNSIGIVTGSDKKYVSSAKSPDINGDKIGDTFDPNLIVDFSYRPFEKSQIYYSQNDLERARFETMRHYVDSPNLGLLTTKAHSDRVFNHCFATNNMSEAIFLSGTTASNAMNLPLYLHPDQTTDQGDVFEQQTILNFEPDIYAEILKAAGIKESNFVWNPLFAEATGDARANEVKVYDYIYGCLHSISYRSNYWQSLTIHYPHIPYPMSPENFNWISLKGEELRRLHLMEPTAIGDTPFPFMGDAPNDGGSIVEKPVFDGPEAPDATEDTAGKVWINKGQYFDAVPRLAWEFYIGGYQPAQKWLKDRKGRELTFDDVRHYQRIIKILTETHRIMGEIEMPMEGG